MGGGGGGGGGGEKLVTFNPRIPFNFYWNNNCIILPKSVDLPQVSASNNYYYTLSYSCRTDNYCAVLITSFILCHHYYVIIYEVI